MPKISEIGLSLKVPNILLEAKKNLDKSKIFKGPNFLNSTTRLAYSSKK